MTPGEQLFWFTYAWTDHPWILDRQGDFLTARKLNRIQLCVIVELEVQRVGVHTDSDSSSLQLDNTHHQVKLRL